MIELPAVPSGAEFLYPKKGMGDMDGLFGNVPSSPGKQGESGEDGKQDPLHGPDESAQPKKPQRTMDPWEEGKHPRGGNPNNTGQFSKAGGGRNSLKNSRNNGNVKTSRKSEHRPRAIKLPKEEYARVVSALNTNFTKEEREMPFLAKAIGDRLYFIRNRGFSDYVVLRRVKIK